jgi:hypothetical protein
VQTTAEQFRKKLVTNLAYGTRWPRQVALHGGGEGLAERLGVTQDVLDEAISLCRMGFRAPPRSGFDYPGKPGTKPSELALLRMSYPLEIMTLVRNLALTMHRAPMNLVRDMLHAAMLTTSEPSRQPRYRHRKMVFRGKLLSGKQVDDNVRISPALKEVIRRRAVAYGETPHAYVRCWLIDLVEGRLGHIDMPPLRMGQMFDSEEAYVLPLLTA